MLFKEEYWTTEAGKQVCDDDTSVIVTEIPAHNEASTAVKGQYDLVACRDKKGGGKPVSTRLYLLMCFYVAFPCDTVSL